MSVTPISTIPILTFINQVKSADLSKQREVRIDIDSARQLALTLGLVMTRLEGDMEVQIQKILADKSTGQDVVTVKLDGGSSW